jgi:dTMP kinase
MSYRWLLYSLPRSAGPSDEPSVVSRRARKLGRRRRDDSTAAWQGCLVPPTSATNRRGQFIVFEGGEGAGKSTQVARLAATLRDEGSNVVVTREPGGTPAAEAIRELVLDASHDGLNDRTEALLFAAARAEHVAGLIAPALARGDTVICDRFIDSSVAYQGLGRGLGAAKIAELSEWATQGLRADLTIVLDIDPVAGLRRAGQVSEVPDRMESQAVEFHEMVRQAFLAAASADPSIYQVIDASESPDAIASQVLAAVRGTKKPVGPAT